MLGTLETLLATPLAQALPRHAKVQVGPGFCLSKSADPTVLVLGKRWWCAETDRKNDKTENQRGPVFLTRYLALQADSSAAGAKAFSLPLREREELLEIHVPPGRLLQLADDYTLQQGTVLFSQSPPVPVYGYVRREEARGYTEKWPFQAELSLYSVAQNALENDALMHEALAVVLRVFAQRDFINITSPDSPDLFLRLLRPMAYPCGTERLDENPLGEKPEKRGVRTLTPIQLRATLELGLIVGKAEKKQRMTRFEYTPG